MWCFKRVYKVVDLVLGVVAWHLFFEFREHKTSRWAFAVRADILEIIVEGLEAPIRQVVRRRRAQNQIRCLDGGLGDHGLPWWRIDQHVAVNGS